jgi:hypothetical protein
MISLQVTVQRRVLDVLAQQIMLGGLASSTSVELCQARLGLETRTRFCKHQVILVDWETIQVLGSVCRPPFLTPVCNQLLPRPAASAPSPTTESAAIDGLSRLFD